MALSALRQQDVKEPILVSRKNLVDVVYQTDHVELRLQAIALEDGKLGDNIRVQNTNSQKIIVGRIAADSTIRMNSPTKSSL
jgi:flagella basal body P-ring formation protein FlgA